jgi:hypothetical protein
VKPLIALAVGWAALGLAHASGAEPRLSPPRLGCFPDEAGHLRLVWGLPGSFLLSEPLRPGILSAACGENYVWLKTADALEWLDSGGRLLGRWSVPGGPAMFGLAGDGSRALVYLPATSQWLLAAGGDLRPLPLDLGAASEDVLGFALTGSGHLAAVVRRAEKLWLLRAGLEDGGIIQQTELAEASAPLLVLTDGAVVWGAGGGLTILPLDGAQRRVPLPASPTQLQFMAPAWIRVTLPPGEGSLALRVLKDRETLYRLPEAAP